MKNKEYYDINKVLNKTYYVYCKKENEKLFIDNVPIDIEHYKSLIEENQILKDGVKELLDILCVCKIEHILTGLEYTIEELKTKNKIKELLEVIDNE